MQRHHRKDEAMSDKQSDYVLTSDVPEWLEGQEVETNG